MKTTNSKTLHATAIQVYKTGVLLVGPSGSGKSECALDLIVKGHKFIADDIVQIEKNRDGTLSAHPLKPDTFLLNIRGVGIVDVKNIFGEHAVTPQMRIDLVIEFASRDHPNAFDLLGDENHATTLLDVPVQKKILPAQTQGLLANIVELLVKKTFIYPS